MKVIDWVIIHHSFALEFFCARNILPNAVLLHLELDRPKIIAETWLMLSSYTKVRVKVIVVREGDLFGKTICERLLRIPPVYKKTGDASSQSSDLCPPNLYNTFDPSRMFPSSNTVD